MKTLCLKSLPLGLLLAVVLVVASCAPAPAETPAPTAPAAATAAAVAPAPPQPLPEPQLEFTPSANLADIIKLARAGVSESLLLKFIQNTSGSFGLGAQEIIYLNDLGVAENVINSLMEHDRACANSNQPPPATVPVAAPAAPAPATVVVEPPPTVIVQPAPVTVNYFDESLTPYGSWIEVEGYGRCWQPTVVVYQRDWQPYCDRGRWVYTDCGWYWASDYSWGNVAFHYGRWFNHPRRGWCWSPDTVWAPAWVSWRRNDDYCGWAPLPPAACYRPGAGFYYQDRSVSIGFEFGLSASCYTFVSRQHFTESHPRRYAAPQTQVTQIFNTTTVNNYYSGGGRNDRVVNHGIAPAVITAGTENQIRPVRAPVPAAPGVRPDRSQFTRSSRESSPAPAAAIGEARPGRPQADSIAARSATPGARTGVVPTTDRAAAPDRANLDRSRENNSHRESGFTRERETASRRPSSEPARTVPEKKFTPAAPSQPTPVAAPAPAAPAITIPSVREREVSRPNGFGSSITRPVPQDRESRSANDSSRNSKFRAPAPSPTPTAPQVMPQPERPGAFSSPSRTFTPPEPRSQPTVQPRSVAPQPPVQTFRAPAPTPTPQPHPQPVAPSYTPAPQRPQYQPAPQPRMETPQPSFTPHSAPAISAPSAPRTESRPASVPASAAPSRSEGRSGNGDREKRDR